MLRVPISQAEPGMALALPVYHPQSQSTVLLRPGAELERRTVDRLRDIGIPEIWIRYPRLGTISRFVSPGVMAARACMAGEVATAFDAAGKTMHARLDFNAYRRAMGALMQKLIANTESAIFVSELVDSGRPAVRHGANVGFISVLMGLRLGFYLLRERKRLPAMLAKDVTNLGVAAMLHDIGMTRLPEPVLRRWQQTHDDSDPEWRRHTDIGFDLVRGNIEPSAAASVLHHHQRFDGSGFPERITLQNTREAICGSSIHIFARIIAAADMYDRLVNPASDPASSPEEHPSIPPVRALNTLLREPYRSRIDPVVLRALLSVCPAFPPGSIVTLNNGMRAVIADWSAMNPCRPVVQELTCFEGVQEIEWIDLRERPELSIIEFEGADVRDDLFAPRFPDEFNLMHIEKLMGNAGYEGEPMEELRSLIA
jgi:HD-GYP domain-containing protein (c-di-GMP phosphodiesterase class II)